MAISYNAMTERQRRVAGAALEVAESTQLAAPRATASLTQAVLDQAVFAMSYPMLLGTAITYKVIEQQLRVAKQVTELFGKPSRKVNSAALSPWRGTTAYDAAPALARTTIDNAAQAFVATADDAAQAFVATADDAAQAFAATADDVTQAFAATATADDAKQTRTMTTEEDQEILLRAERLVINKQNVKLGEARVRKEIVTEMQTIQVPVSHEELVIEKFAVTGDVDADVDSAPIASETIRIPLTEEKAQLSKKTFVREVVEIGKSRVDAVEHISDTVRHEELLVDGLMTNPAGPEIDADNYVKTPDDAAPALITPAQALATIPDDVVPALITPAQALATTPDGGAPKLVTPAQALATMPDGVVPALITPGQALATTPDGVAPKLVTPGPAVAMAPDEGSPELVTTGDDTQEIDLRAERLVMNKQRVQTGKARVRKEIVTETKSIAVPVTHEELVINRQAVTGDVDADVDSAPIADGTIHVPLTEDKVNVGKETVVREEVEIGKRRVDGMEHISDTVRHEELRVNDTTNNEYEPAL